MDIIVSRIMGPHVQYVAFVCAAVVTVPLLHLCSSSPSRPSGFFSVVSILSYLCTVSHLLSLNRSISGTSVLDCVLHATRKVALSAGFDVVNLTFDL